MLLPFLLLSLSALLCSCSHCVPTLFVFLLSLYSYSLCVSTLFVLLLCESYHQLGGGTRELNRQHITASLQPGTLKKHEGPGVMSKRTVTRKEDDDDSAEQVSGGPVLKENCCMHNNVMFQLQHHCCAFQWAFDFGLFGRLAAGGCGTAAPSKVPFPSLSSHTRSPATH